MSERLPPDVLLTPGPIGDLVERVWAVVRPIRAVTGLATVELDRAQREVVQRLGLGEPVVEEVRGDEHLGAAARLLTFGTGQDLLLLEPATEGRLAASLARSDEGRVALYLVVTSAALDDARRAGVRLSAEAPGPLGRERLVVGTPRHDPYLVLVESEDEPAPETGTASVTIEG